jgi:hypothetical protein
MGRQSPVKRLKARSGNRSTVSHMHSPQSDMDPIKAVVTDYYRCPAEHIDLESIQPGTGAEGFFRFGPRATCYGRCSTGPTAHRPGANLYDCFGDTQIAPGGVRLGFDPAKVIESLRTEHYVGTEHTISALVKSLSRDAYYILRPVTHTAIRTRVQRMYYRSSSRPEFPTWPVDFGVDSILQTVLLLLLRSKPGKDIPFIWFWPDAHSSCAMMTHDIETEQGKRFCPQLMDMNASFNIKAAFEVIPECRYQVTDSFLDSLLVRGHEINVHDLNHDGRLFRTHQTFLERARKINSYARAWGAQGFRSGAMYRRLEWFDALDVAYDMSVPNVAHMEPQRGGCCTVMPYFVNDDLLELPLTTTQDFALFNLLRQNTIDHWKDQIGQISAQHGLISFIVHPDYITRPQEQKLYIALLTHLSALRAKERLWIARPKEVNEWWRKRSAMRLVRRGENWIVEGAGSERARVAYARLEDDRLAYQIEAPVCA